MTLEVGAYFLSCSVASMPFMPRRLMFMMPIGRRSEWASPMPSTTLPASPTTEKPGWVLRTKDHVSLTRLWSSTIRRVIFYVLPYLFFCSHICKGKLTCNRHPSPGADFKATLPLNSSLRFRMLCNPSQWVALEASNPTPLSSIITISADGVPATVKDTLVA